MGMTPIDRRSRDAIVQMLRTMKRIGSYWEAADAVAAMPVEEGNVCPDCKNRFVQPFLCITCGAEKLYDATVKSQAEVIAATRQRLAAAEGVLTHIVECWEARSELYPGDEQCAATLADHARAFLQQAKDKP